MNDHSDNEFADNKKLSDLYRAGSTAQPPAHVDRAILAKARRSVSPVPQRTRPSWAVPVSIAAILVLSVSLISLIHQGAPTVSDIPGDAPLSITPAEKTGITESGISAEQKNEIIAEEETPAQNSVMTARQKPQKFARKEKSVRKTETLNSLITPAPFSEAINVPQPDSDTEQKTEGELISELFQRVTPQPENTGLKKDHYSGNDQHCEWLSDSACLDSKKCNLTKNAQNKSVCSRSINHCDSGFSQQSGTKENCEAKNGCVYISEPCLCPTGVICTCNEKQLPHCQALNTSGAGITSQPESASPHQ